MSPAVVAELVADYEAGMSTPKLCKRYGLSKTSVLKLLREAGMKTRQRGLNDQQVAQAVELYNQGHSYAEIGRRLGKAKSSVREVLRRNIPINDLNL